MDIAVRPPVDAPRRHRRLALISALAGVVLAVVWSPGFVDKVIAGGLANPVFGEDIATIPITGTGMALAFAFVTGVAGMFTACNIAVFSALAPMTAQEGTRWTALWRPVGLLLAGAVAVAGLYGAIGVYVGDESAQLSPDRIGDPETGLLVRILQAGIIFGIIGAIMLWRGLGYAGIIRNPLASFFGRHPWAETLFLGGLIGAFLIGRPFPPFRNLYGYAAATDNPLIGFATFALQSAGNVAGVVVLFALVTIVTRGRLQRWLTREPGRSDRVAAAGFILVGTFFLVYWTVRLGARAGVMWWPDMPYNV